MEDFDVVILGAGGAGLMCAIHAGKRGRRVLVLDHAKKIGGKILISGGGRCNFTNLTAGHANYVSENPHFCKSALSRYPSENFIQLVREHGIPFHEKKLGQLFCDVSAQSIVTLLETECERAGVEIRMETQIAGRRYRRPVDSETRCDWFRLRHRPAVRLKACRARACARWLYLSRSWALPRSRRDFSRLRDHV
jgi:predicted Rossmann fold flavoprotein